MKTRFITYISILGVVLIFAAQSYVVYNNYKITRDFLTRESDAILESAFRQDLTARHKKYKVTLGETDETIPPLPPTKQNTQKVDMSHTKDLGDNVLGVVDLAINYVVSQKFPLDLNQLDSITGVVLQQRNILSAYKIIAIDNSGRITAESKADLKASVFVIKSKAILVSHDKNISLQLQLINPFQSVFKRMGLLLSASFVLSILCFYGLWFLFRTLARHKKLMAVKNDFFGNTAHELKRPVAQLHLAIEALSKPGTYENTEKRERYLAISREATQDMSEKITMIMTLSMAEEGVFKLNYSHFNLLEEVQKLKEQFSVVSGKEVSIEIEKTADDYGMKGDKDHLRQSLANLIDNAIKYSGNSVKIFISLQKMKDILLLSVKDNGIGIDADKVDTVFQKYTRLNTGNGNPGGFGIGLSYVKTVIDKHAGSIEVRSEKGKGSEFILSLPIRN